MNSYRYCRRNIRRPAALAAPGMQPHGDARRRSPGARRGDGIVRTTKVERRLFTGASRGDGIGCGAKGERRLFTGASRGDGIIRAGAMGGRERGFSLIEIILVVVLIGGIVAFAASRILGGGDRAKANLTRAQVQTMAEKVSQFELDTGTLPNSLEELVSQPGKATGWLGPYAKQAELKDPWNNPYVYNVPGDGQPFDLISLGKDGKPGGESVDGDVKFQ